MRRRSRPRPRPALAARSVPDGSVRSSHESPGTVAPATIADSQRPWSAQGGSAAPHAASRAARRTAFHARLAKLRRRRCRAPAISAPGSRSMHTHRNSGCSIVSDLPTPHAPACAGDSARSCASICWAPRREHPQTRRRARSDKRLREIHRADRRRDFRRPSAARATCAPSRRHRATSRAPHRRSIGRLPKVRRAAVDSPPDAAGSMVYSPCMTL